MSRFVRTLASSLVLMSILFIGASQSTDAAYQQLYYQWSHLASPPGGPLHNYQGDYLGRSDWNHYAGTNFFTRHESSVVVTNPTSAITGQSTHLTFYHGGVQKFTVPYGAWNPCCYVIPPGAIHFGGNTNNYTYGYSASPGGVDRGIFAFQLCDAGGCYGGYTRNEPWTLWT